MPSFSLLIENSQVLGPPRRCTRPFNCLLLLADLAHGAQPNYSQTPLGGRKAASAPIELRRAFILRTTEALARRNEKFGSNGRPSPCWWRQYTDVGECLELFHASLNSRPRFNGSATSNFNATGGSSGHQCTMPCLSQ